MKCQICRKGPGTLGVKLQLVLWDIDSEESHIPREFEMWVCRFCFADARLTQVDIENMLHDAFYPQEKQEIEPVTHAPAS